MRLRDAVKHVWELHQQDPRALYNPKLSRFLRRNLDLAEHITYFYLNRATERRFVSPQNMLWEDVFAQSVLSSIFLNHPDHERLKWRAFQWCNEAGICHGSIDALYRLAEMYRQGGFLVSNPDPIEPTGVEYTIKKELKKSRKDRSPNFDFFFPHPGTDDIFDEPVPPEILSSTNSISTESIPSEALNSTNNALSAAGLFDPDDVFDDL